MKNLKLPILGLSLVLLVASCKKEDFKEESSIDTAASNTTSFNETDTVGWLSAAQWETADQETFSVRYITIEDANITSDVADNGLVLLFKKSGNAVNALPFEESAGNEEVFTDNEETGTDTDNEEVANANYWYHQVTEGSLLISCDVYETAAATDGVNRFKYFIITPEKLQSLQADGHATEDLMNLSYAEATALLEGVK